MPQNLLEITDLSREELHNILQLALKIKEGEESLVSEMSSKTLTMIFQKPSTRTRVSFEVGMTQMDGHAVYLDEKSTQLGRGEPIKDTARVLSSYSDFLMARTRDHKDLETLADYSSVPVINGLSDKAHPCQALADLMTIKEVFGDKDPQVTWVGDTNNVCRSLVKGCLLLGIDVSIASPDVEKFDSDILNQVDVFEKPVEAVRNSDVIYTDVWVSMGESEETKDIEKLKDYQINQELVEDAGVKVMHCLPANRGEEITDEVLESSSSLVWRQAENRLHVQKALLKKLNKFK